MDVLWYAESCFLTRELFTEQVTESHGSYNTIQSNECLIEFRKIKCKSRVYVCRHGQRQHSVRRVKPSIKRYTWSPVDDAESLLRRQCLSLSDSDLQRLASFLDRHRSRVNPGTNVIVVAEIMIHQIEVVKKCVRNEPMNLAAEMGSRSSWIPIANDGLISVSVSIEEDDNNTAASSCDLGMMHTKFLIYGDDTCSICLDKFSKVDDIVRTACSHNFHPDCIRTWMTRRTNCPYCRARIQI